MALCVKSCNRGLKMAAILNVFLLSLFVSKTVTYTQLVNANTIAVSSSIYHNYVASRAVDGNVDQKYINCSHTDVRNDITEAWLRIDLGREYSVKSVKIWYRADRGSTYYNTARLRGYSLRVSTNTNVPPPESSCYNEPGNVTLPTIVEEDCERTTRYIWIYQANKPNNEPCPFLEICEVQVFGCNVGYYGEDCSKKCNHCRNNATCGIQNGECDALGCSNYGYQPPLCQPCNDGEYGVNCLFNCSGHCLNGEVCNKIDGSCRSCAIGFNGMKCDKECQAGKYGEACSESCGACVNSTVCNHITGSCEQGCEPGWQKTKTCKTGCILGMYGLNCEKKCSQHCAYDYCDRKTGICLEGCKSGYIGGFCTQTCPLGKYGPNCREICGHCYNDSDCFYGNGTCLDGCDAGYWDHDCKTPCSDGKYGNNCQYSCSGKCMNGEACNKINGSCRSCVDGFQGSKCDRDIRQSPTDFKTKIDIDHLKMETMMLENHKTQKEIQRLEAETEVLRVRKNVLLKLQGILSELSEVVVQLLNDSKV